MREDYYKFGYDILGPFLHGFVFWLKKSFRDSGIEKVFFLSRDGYLMLNAFRMLDDGQYNQECSYVYFSRNSIRRSLLWCCQSYEESLKYYSNCRYTTLNELSSYYGLSQDQIAGVCENASEIWNDSIEYSSLVNNTLVKNIYIALEKDIKNNSKRQFELLKKYLEQEGVSGKCAIVDIGWHGSMQRYIEEFVSIIGINASFHGYYVGHTPVAKLKGTADGWLYNCESSSMRKKVLCFFGVIEKFFQVQEGSTYGYQHKDGKVCPLLEEYEFEGEKKYSELLKHIQDGALEYVRRHSDISPGESSWKKMIQFGTSPSLSQTKLFVFLCNKDGAKTYFLPQKGLFSYSLVEFIRALSNSAWKTGFMKMAFKIPLPYYWLYKLMRK